MALLLVACGGGSGSGSKPSGISPAPPPASFSAPPTLGADWPEYHGGPDRSGVGPPTPVFANPQMAWRAPVDGDVYASPLIVAGHVIVATENNTVYSLDLFSGAVVWKLHLGDPVDAGTLPCGDISPVTGITGTPAADPRTDRLYVVAYIRGYRHVLFTIGLANGSVILQQVVDPPGSDPRVQQERGALALGSGYVYVPFGGLYGDCGTYHGYVAAVPEDGGTMLVYKTPTATGAGIWSAQGPTIATSGSVYAVTGNGSSRSAFDFSNAVIDLSPDLRVQSYFAPSDWVSLNVSDTDLGSVGATVLSSMGMVVSIGKQGVAYLLKADQLGAIGGQIAALQVCSGAWGGAAWSGGTVYLPCADGLVALSVTPTTIAVAWKTPHPEVGSPILAAGAVWAIEAATAKLFALDPATGAVMQSFNLGAAAHFSTPAATDGFVVAPAGPAVEAISTAT